MNVLIDHHHYELALSLALLFKRFNCNVYIPTESTISTLGIYGHGCVSFNMQQKYTQITALPYNGDQRIDLCISSVPQNYPIFKKICDKTIQQIGNHEWTLLDFDHVLTSDLFSYRRFKAKNTRVCYYYPELDLLKYKPKLIENRNIRSYIVNLKEPYGYTFCKVCDQHHQVEYPDYKVFEDCQKELKHHQITLIHKHIEHYNLRGTINDSRLTWHMKPVEGYGFSAISSLLCGVPILINPKWLHGTTLMTLCIPFKTAWYSPYTMPALLSSCLDIMGKDQEKTLMTCHNIVKSILDFDSEADKVKRFIECVI